MRWRIAWETHSNRGHGEYLWLDFTEGLGLASAYKKDEPSRRVWLESVDGERIEIVKEA